MHKAKSCHAVPSVGDVRSGKCAALGLHRLCATTPGRRELPRAGVFVISWDKVFVRAKAPLYSGDFLMIKSRCTPVQIYRKGDHIETFRWISVLEMADHLYPIGSIQVIGENGIKLKGRACVTLSPVFSGVRYRLGVLRNLRPHCQNRLTAR